jgi:hypothetical protein
MELQALLLLFGVLALVGVYIAQPFLRSYHKAPASDQAHSSLLAERERLLSSLRELDIDHTLGKIPEEDYLVQRSELVHLGGEVMEKLDALAVSAAENSSHHEEKQSEPISDDEIENLVAKRRSARKNQTDGFCPRCGKAILTSDRFCPGCGHELQ